MATNFPTGLDDFANYVDGTTIMEAALLNDMQFAIEALQAKVGIDNSGVSSSHDYKLANQWQHDGTQVFDATSPTSWTDLDLSSYVGSNRALVFLKVKENTAERSIGFRTNGDTEDALNETIPSGCASVRIPNGEIAYVIIETDAAGIIEWKAQGADNIDIWLMGYMR